MINENATRHTLSVLVDNASGVLSQVSRLFSRKGYNIESLAVGATDNPEVSRITIEVLADDRRAAGRIRYSGIGSHRHGRSGTWPVYIRRRHQS